MPGHRVAAVTEALIYGSIYAAFPGLVTGKIRFAAIFSIPEKRGVSTGLVENGILSVVTRSPGVLVESGTGGMSRLNCRIRREDRT